jgi:hypothetical protein
VTEAAPPETAPRRKSTGAPCYDVGQDTRFASILGVLERLLRVPIWNEKLSRVPILTRP